MIQQNYLHHFTQNQLYIQYLILLKMTKFMKIPLWDLGFRQNFAIFTMCSKHEITYISRLTILS